MPRPKVPASRQRTHRITLYLNETEWAATHEAAAREQRPLTQIFLRALTYWLDRLTESGPTWQQARFERIMDATNEELIGWICPRSHGFWTAWVEPMAPQQCPICGSRSLKRTWGGVVHRTGRGPTAP
jgi:hypothetical protein